MPSLYILASTLSWQVGEKNMKEKRLNIKTAKKLIFICFSMFLFSFALVPLYNVICDVTGLNGNTSNLKEKVEFYTESESLEKLNIQFISHGQNNNDLV